MWRVLTETDANGYVTRWQHDGLGRITRIDYPNNGFVTYAYNDTQKTLTHRTVLGATYVYRYDGFGNLLTITAPGSVVVLTNSYDNRMRLADTRNAQGITSSQRTTFSYDVRDRQTERRSLNPSGVTMHRTTISYDDIANRVTATVHGDANAPSIQTFAQYDVLGRVTQEGITGGRVFAYTYNIGNQIIREQSWGVDNTFSNNVFGVTSVRNIEGNTARMVYDSMGRVIRSSDFMGNYTTFTHDALGRLIRQDVPFERVANTTHNATTRYFYDGNGNTTRIQTLINLPGQPQVWSTIENTFRHNMLMSSQTGSTASESNVTVTFDFAGGERTGGGERIQIIPRGSAAIAPEVTRNGGWIFNGWNTAFDSVTANITVVAQWLRVGAVSTNGTGNVTSADIIWLARSVVGHTGFELSNRRVANLRGDDRDATLDDVTMLLRWLVGYDLMHLISSLPPGNNNMPAQTIGTVGVRTEYTYGLAGNILTQRVGNTTTTYAYNNLGQLTHITDALGQAESFTHDNNGLLLTHTDRNGTIFRNTHDNMGRLTRINAERNSSIVNHNAFTYTATGSARTETNGAHTITYSYDAQGRAILKAETGGIEKTYLYNTGNMPAESRVIVSGSTHIHKRYTYDTAGRIRTVTSNNQLLNTYSYNANGSRINEALGNGVTVAYNHNLAGFITSATNSNGTNIMSSFLYTHHLDGNTRQVVEQHGAEVHTLTYTYDIARRLTKEHRTTPTSNQTREYTFDNRGNRITTRATGVDNYHKVYAYDSNNRLTQTTKTPKTGNQEISNFTYDRNGNQLTQATGGQTETRTYNGFNQLTQVTATSPSMTTNYTYRADGLRHSKTINNATTTHVWDGASIVLERNQSGAIINRFERCLTGRLIRSTHHGWYLHNARGDVSQRVNDSRNILQNYRYNAFGTEFSPNVSNNNPHRFAGEYLDAERGEYYLKARSLSPRIGRFTQPDPFWGIHNMQLNSAAILQSGNLYAYCINNPVMYIDPTGLFLKRAALGAAVGGTIGGIGGGVKAAANGENILQGAVNGFISGASGGAFVASGLGFIKSTTPLLAAGAISFASGFGGGVVSNVTAQALDHFADNGSLSGFQPSWEEAAIQGAIAGVFTAAPGIMVQATNIGYPIHDRTFNMDIAFTSFSVANAFLDFGIDAGVDTFYHYVYRPENYIPNLPQVQAPVFTPPPPTDIIIYRPTIDITPYISATTNNIPTWTFPTFTF
jgi:RHS repeat-associated protein